MLLNDVNARLSSAVFLLFTLGLFASWSHGAEGPAGAETSEVSQREQTDRPAHPHHDHALFIAGMSNAKGSPAALESSPAMYNFFPDAKTYVMISLERVGRILDFPSIWDLKLFGACQKPLPALSDRYQKDLAELYQKTKNIRPISFGVGYHHLPGPANLQLATRKKTPPPGEFH